jgi:hypothetical protein
VVNHPAVTSAIVGPRTMEQLDSQLPAADVVLDQSTLDRIDDIVRPGLNLNLPTPATANRSSSPPCDAARSQGVLMQITRSSIDTQKGPADWFTGDVFIDAVAGACRHVDIRLRARPLHTPRMDGLAHASARPDDLRHGGSRHVSARGRPIEVIHPGDRVFFEPGENHGHGATPNRFMTHIAMQQNDESGSPVTWGEQVSDEQYAAAPTR